MTDVRCDIADRVATVTFARPDKLNAFRAATMREFLSVLDDLDANTDVRAVIVTGEGRAFCAGADVSGGAEKAFTPVRNETGEAREAPRDGGGILALRINAMTKPMIAAVNGAAVGMGATMTLPMDIRLGSTNARFAFPFVRRGIIPEGCSSWFLPRVVGISAASAWMLSGRMIPADEALDAGLVHALHDPDELLPAAHAIARDIAEHAAPASVAMTRRLLREMLGATDPMDAHLAESRGLARRARSDDAREGVTSFLEKRSPQFNDQATPDDLDLFGR
jgi:enoyl-CoA hydratase/carnithine racemase